MQSDKLAKKMLLNLNRKEIKITFEGEDYTFAEPSLQEVLRLEKASSIEDAFSITKGRQLDGNDLDTLGASTQIYLINKYLEWIAKIMNKIT